MKRPAFLLVAVVLVGCGGPVTWKMSGPDNHGSNSLASVSAFVATKGWNMYTNEGGIFWEELDTNWIISDLPWRSLTNRQYRALTCGGILTSSPRRGRITSMGASPTIHTPTDFRGRCSFSGRSAVTGMCGGSLSSYRSKGNRSMSRFVQRTKIALGHVSALI